MHRLYECWCGGENYDGARPCNFDWVKHLREECEKVQCHFLLYRNGYCVYQRQQNLSYAEKTASKQDGL